jgi:hypothetical protein
MACTEISELTPCPNNAGSYFINAAFSDDDGAFTPNTVTWSLSDQAGNIINSRQDVSITPAASVKIVLGAADLQASDGYDRLITINYVYNSATYGNNLPDNAQAKFDIGPYIVVPAV